MIRFRSIAIALAASLVLAYPASAQWSFGAGAGVTFATLGGDVVASSNSRVGFTAGVSGEYHLEDLWRVGLEANYVQRGGNSVRFVATASTDFFDVHLDYIEFPLTIKAALPMSDDWTARVYGGVALAIEVSCSVTEGGAGSQDCASSTLGLSARSTEWSLPFGAMFSYQLGGGSSLGVDLRYVLGVSSTLSTVDARNRTFEVLGRWFMGR